MATIGIRGKIELTADEIKFIKRNWKRLSNQQLADSLGLKLTRTRMFLYEMGLKRMELEYWTEEQISFLLDNYKEIGDVELAEIFNSKWVKNKGWTKKHIEKKRRYLKLKRTAVEIENIFLRNLEAGRFQECVKKRWETTGSNPIATILFWRRNKHSEEKIAVIKTTEGYMHYYRWLYEQANGKLTPQDLVAPKVDAPSGILLTLDQLEVIDRSEHAIRNAERRMAYPEEIRKAIRTYNKINKTLKEENHGK